MQHAIGVLALASRHWRRVPWRNVRHALNAKRSFLRAAFFHDVGKKFDRDRHDLAGAEWMAPRDPLAAYLIMGHMGRWGAPWSERQGVALRLGILEWDNQETRWLADMLAACDYTEAVCWSLHR